MKCRLDSLIKPTLLFVSLFFFFDVLVAVAVLTS